MAQIEVAADVRAKLSGDKRYLCEAMGTPLPLLPVHGKQENLLFSNLALQQLGGRSNAKLDFDELAITWCAHVNGTTIFPKLPVYLRQHFTSWERNQRIKDALRSVAPDLEGWRAQFAGDAATIFGGSTEAAADSSAAPAAATPAADAAPAVATAPAAADATCGARGAARRADDAAEEVDAAQAAADAGITAARAAADAIRATPLLAQHTVLPRAPAMMAEARADNPCVVAGLLIGDGREPPPRHQAGRKRGRGRKRDGVRRVRHCNLEKGGCGSSECPGRGGVAFGTQRVHI
eukprot:134953-Prymnesium_polylepis.1